MRSSGSPEEPRGRIGGSGIYLGWFLPHFGHALLEGLSRCWALDDFDFAVYHGPLSVLPEILEFHLDRLGTPPVILPNRPVSFERLVVPRPAFEIGTRAYTGFLDPLPRPSGEEQASAPVYLRARNCRTAAAGSLGRRSSRRRSTGTGSSTLSACRPAEQLEVFSRHPTFAGPVGSAMDNIVFARSPRVVYLADERPAPTYLQCDELVEAESLYVGCCDLGGLPSLGRSTPLRLDLAFTKDALGVSVEVTRQAEIDRRHRTAWAEMRLRRGIREDDASGHRRGPGPYARDAHWSP